MQIFDGKAEVVHFSIAVPLETIAKRNAELKTTVARIDTLRVQMDAIVAEIESTRSARFHP